MLHIGIDRPKPFTRKAPQDLREALALGADPDAVYIAGGGDLLDQLKTRLRRPATLVDLKRLPGLTGVTVGSAAISIGALTTLAAIAGDQRIAAALPALATSAARVATPQLRNTATLGGNLLQDSRCPYYREGWPCRRAGGRSCYAHRGLDGDHALFGGDPCWTVTPSDLAPVLVALDAELEVQGPQGARRLAVADLFVDPFDDVRHMHRLGAGEILTRAQIPTAPGRRSHFVKITRRGAWDFALASAAVAATLDDGRLHGCRIVLGGVAPMPWRCRAAEQILEGAMPTTERIEAATAATLTDAEPSDRSAYRLPLVRQAMTDALEEISR